MRRRRKKRESIQLSLFPFLAVLICTLGVLIILLVVAVKHADVEARKVRESERQDFESKKTKLELELSKQQVVVEGLKQVRPQAVKRMADLRNQRGHLESEIRRLDKEASKLAQQAVQVESKAASPVLAPDDDELEELKSRIELAKQAVEEVREVAKNYKPVVYSIVPHEGEDGTNRRPIYLECTIEGIRFQPHNVLLTRHDFIEPLLPGNPLDAALLAIRDYWTRYDLAGEAGPPYPLIVVRPDGAKNYILARKAMQSWDSEFGYEVVEEDKSLHFGEADNQLTQEITQAIEYAKRQQVGIVAAREQLQRLRGTVGESGSAVGLVASSPNGGFVNQGNAVSENTRRAELAGFNDLDSSTGNETADKTASFDSILDHYRRDGESQSGMENLGADVPGKKSQASSGKPDEKQSHSQNGRGASSSTSEGGATSMGTTFSSPSSSIAASRGVDWALPTRTPGSVGFLRPIRIYCFPEKLVIVASASELISVRFQGPTQNAVPELVDHLWQIIDQWGEAGQNGYWKPELKINVSQDADQRFNDLKILLQGSGLTVERGK